MNTKLWHIGLRLAGSLLILWGFTYGLDAYHQHQAGQHEVQANHHDQEAQAHVNQAQSIPDHTAALESAQKDADSAWAEVRRLRKIVASQKPGVSNQTIPDSPVQVQPTVDHRDELLAADAVLIKAQDTQITGLKTALSDEQQRSYHWESAYNDEHKAFMAQQAATEAWKKAVKESRWTGRIEGFAAGIALGYAGGKL